MSAQIAAIAVAVLVAAAGERADASTPPARPSESDLFDAPPAPDQAAPSAVPQDVLDAFVTALDEELADVDG